MNSFPCLLLEGKVDALSHRTWFFAFACRCDCVFLLRFGSGNSSVLRLLLLAIISWSFSLEIGLRRSAGHLARELSTGESAIEPNRSYDCMPYSIWTPKFTIAYDNYSSQSIHEAASSLIDFEERVSRPRDHNTGEEAAQRNLNEHFSEIDSLIN